jgi:hypothetical protein
MTNIHQLSSDTLLHLLAWELVGYARDELKLAISSDLANTVVPVTDDLRAVVMASTSGLSAVRAAVAEVARISQQGRVALLVDGLEKLRSGMDAREIFDALSQLPESIDLILVIPWHAAFGGGGEPILRAGERLHRVPVLDIEGETGIAAARFMGRVLASRLRCAAPLSDSFALLMGRAFQSSGGIPRVFLQLMADAGTYARVKRAAAWPDESDLQEAIADQQDSFRRALLPGDTQSIRAVIGTDGRELDLERRIRLMAQGILLERARNGTVVLEVHPLAAPVLENTRA